MAIPAQILSAVKDLLRIPANMTTSDARMTAAYETALAEFTRETDCFATIHPLPAVAEQSIYAAPANTTRVLLVLHAGTVLMLVPTRSLDLLTTWQTAVPGEPEEWVMDKLPPSLDGLTVTTPLQFAIHPAPKEAGTGAAGLTIIRIGIPANDTPPAWMWNYFVYRTASIYCGETTEERDEPASQFWGALADVWRELVM